MFWNPVRVISLGDARDSDWLWGVVRNDAWMTDAGSGEWMTVEVLASVSSEECMVAVG